jgi:hypothetical protein
MVFGRRSRLRPAALGVACGFWVAGLLYGAGDAPAITAITGIPGVAPLAMPLTRHVVDARATAVQRYQALSGWYTANVAAINDRYPETFVSDTQQRAYYTEMAALESAWSGSFDAITFPEEMQADVRLMVSTEARVVHLLAAASKSAAPMDLAPAIAPAYDDTALAANAIRADLRLPLLASVRNSPIV